MDLGIGGFGAVVTGASRGLGAAIARCLAAEGANVVAAARTADALADLAAEWPGRIEAAPCDMRDTDAVAALAGVCTERFGRLDAVVNNAGIAPAGRLVDTDLSVMEETIAVNVIAPAALARAAARHWMAAKKPGSVVNIASTSGLKGKALLSGYSASKGALVRLTEALAAEWARHRIRVNTIAPAPSRPPPRLPSSTTPTSWRPGCARSRPGAWAPPPRSAPWPPTWSPRCRTS